MVDLLELGQRHLPGAIHRQGEDTVAGIHACLARGGRAGNHPSVLIEVDRCPIAAQARRSSFWRNQGHAVSGYNRTRAICAIT